MDKTAAIIIYCLSSLIGIICLLIIALNLKGRNKELNDKLKEGIISKKIITPEIRLTTDGKTIDTLYIYK